VGIGLAVVHQLVDLYKGYRCFLGRTEQGAKFAIKLPLITAPKIFARAGRRSNKPAELEALVDVLQKLPKTLRNGRRKKSLN
jgi:hypothetical protein